MASAKNFQKITAQSVLIWISQVIHHLTLLTLPQTFPLATSKIKAARINSLRGLIKFPAFPPFHPGETTALFLPHNRQIKIKHNPEIPRRIPQNPDAQSDPQFARIAQGRRALPFPSFFRKNCEPSIRESVAKGVQCRGRASDDQRCVIGRVSGKSTLRLLKWICQVFRATNNDSGNFIARCNQTPIKRSDYAAQKIIQTKVTEADTQAEYFCTRQLYN